MKIIKKIFLAVTIAFTVLSCGETEVHSDYYANGTLKEEYAMKKGQFVGKYKAQYSNGKPQAIGEYSDGKMIGVWQYFYESGKRQSIQEYSNGKVTNINYWDEDGNQLVIEGTGIVEKHYSSGLLESKMSYRNCVFDGKCETWFPNGIKASESFYKDGKPTGIWRYWDENGELIKTENY